MMQGWAYVITGAVLMMQGFASMVLSGLLRLSNIATVKTQFDK